jgi:hypothetical protein
VKRDQPLTKKSFADLVIELRQALPESSIISAAVSSNKVFENGNEDKLCNPSFMIVNKRLI